MHVYEVRPRKDKRGIDLISDALPFRRLWHSEPNAASDEIDYANFYSRSHDAVIRVYDDAGNVIETHEHKGEFKPVVKFIFFPRGGSLVLGKGADNQSQQMRTEKWLRRKTF
jgi:hypothetical protein